MTGISNPGSRLPGLTRSMKSALIVLVSASAGWAVKYYLDQVSPNVAMRQVAITFNFPGPGQDGYAESFIDFSSQELSLVSRSGLPLDLLPSTPLHELGGFLEPGMAEAIRAYYDATSADLASFVDLSTERPLNEDAVVSYFMETTGDNSSGVLPTLFLLEQNEDISIPITSDEADAVLAEVMTPVGPRLAPNRYIDYSVIETDTSQNRLYIPLILRLAALIVQERFEEFTSIFESSLGKLPTHRAEVTDFHQRMLDRVADTIAQFRHVLVSAAIVNDGRNAAILAGSATLEVRDPLSASSYDLRATVEASDGLDGRTSGQNTVYRTVVVPPHSHLDVRVHSDDSLAAFGDRLRGLEALEALEVRLRLEHLNARAPFGSHIETAWVRIESS